MLIAANDDCSSYECVGQAAVLPLYIAVGMLGGMVVGGGVGLTVGTIVDDNGESQTSLGLRVTLRGL